MTMTKGSTDPKAKAAKMPFEKEAAELLTELNIAPYFGTFPTTYLVHAAATLERRHRLTRAADERRFAPLVEFVEEEAGGDCREYDKHLSPKPCGRCLSCRARKALSKLTPKGRKP